MNAECISTGTKEARCQSHVTGRNSHGQGFEERVPNRPGKKTAGISVCALIGMALWTALFVVVDFMVPCKAQTILQRAVCSVQSTLCNNGGNGEMGKWRLLRCRNFGSFTAGV